MIFTFKFDHFEWLSQLYSEWRRISKLANLKISLGESGYAVHVKIWKWLKLLNSVPFIKKTTVNHIYIRIWSSLQTFTVLQWMKTNFKISQFSRFLLRSKYAIQVKIWKWLKLINSVKFIKKTLVNHVHIRIWLFWLTFTVFSEWRNAKKLVKFQAFP